MSQQRNFFDVDKMEAYNEFKNEKMWGYFFFAQPTLVINDEELAKHIMIKEKFWTQCILS